MEQGTFIRHAQTFRDCSHAVNRPRQRLQKPESRMLGRRFVVGLIAGASTAISTANSLRLREAVGQRVIFRQ